MFFDKLFCTTADINLLKSDIKSLNINMLDIYDRLKFLEKYQFDMEKALEDYKYDSIDKVPTPLQTWFMKKYHIYFNCGWGESVCVNYKNRVICKFNEKCLQYIIEQVEKEQKNDGKD